MDHAAIRTEAFPAISRVDVLSKADTRKKLLLHDLNGICTGRASIRLKMNENDTATVVGYS